MPTDGAGRDPRDPAGFSGVGDAATWGVAAARPRERRRARLLAAVAAILVLALAAGGAGGILLARHADVPTATPGTASALGPATASTAMGSTVTVGPGASPAAPTATPALAPTATPTAAPTATPTAAPTATPLLTPTMVVSANPLTFQPYPSQSPKNCVAMQQLTNVSAVAATWSWTNAPSASGWQYNTVGFGSTSWPAFPSPLTMTTPANSSVYVYIRTGLDKGANGYCTNKPVPTATIGVAGGNRTHFTVTY